MAKILFVALILVICITVVLSRKEIVFEQGSAEERGVAIPGMVAICYLDNNQEIRVQGGLIDVITGMYQTIARKRCVFLKKN